MFIRRYFPFLLYIKGYRKYAKFQLSFCLHLYQYLVCFNLIVIFVNITQ